MNIQFKPWQIVKRLHPVQLKVALILTLVSLISLALLLAQAASAAGAGGGGGGITHLMM